ncbi:MAG: HAD family hydrolase [Thermaceae bacterium]
MKALLFDLDGTLADTDPLHLLAWREALRPYGIEVDEAFYYGRISGRLNPEIIRDLLPHLPEGEAQALIQRKEALFRGLAPRLKPLPGLLDLLEEAGRKSLPTALVTNAPRENVEHILNALGLRFPVVVLAEEVGRGKPDPLPYLEALHRLGVNPGEALAFEDSESGVKAAVGAGIPTLGVNAKRPDRLLQAGALGVIPDFRGFRLP